MAHDGFGNRHLQDAVVHLRRMDGAFPHPAAQACLRCKDGSTCHAIFPSHNQRVSESAFVAIGGTGHEQFADILMLRQKTLRCQFVETFS